MKATLRIFVVIVAAGASAAWLLMSVTAQKRSRNEFFHSTAAHKNKDCAFCHKTPTPNSESVRGFPDVADYPGHVSCMGCHRSDFFSGNRPAICTICHSNPSPSNGTRFPFPARSRSTEFTTTFPHDVHQDIIARNERPDGTVPAHFVAVAYRPLSDGKGGAVPSMWQQDAAATAGRMPALRWEAVLTEDVPPTFNNCAICHQVPATLPKYGDRTALRGQPLVPAGNDAFVPGAGFFKSTPEGHASCFSCHYQGQKPIRSDCAGCHTPARPYVGPGVVARYSLKFDHQSANHVNKDCTTCHVRITQNSDLATMKDADVPFMTCASCHARELKEETDKRAASTAGKLPVFQCAFCHSPGIGRYEIPASHRNR